MKTVRARRRTAVAAGLLVLLVAATSVFTGQAGAGANLTLTKAFVDDPVPAGDEVTLEFTITSAGAPAGDIAFSDDLSAVLPGLQATGATANTCGGMATSPFPTGVFTYAGGSLGAGAACMISLTVEVPIGAGPGIYTNTTSTITSNNGSGPAAADDLTVVGPPILTKEFTDDPVAPGDGVTLEFTIANPNPGETLVDLAFADDLDAALTGLDATGATANTCGGMATSPFPTGIFLYEGGTLDPAGACTITLTLDVPPGAAPGMYPNATTSPTAALLDQTQLTGEPGTDVLHVATASLSLTKTVGLVPAVCGATNNLQVAASTTVYYCYTATNTGEAPLTTSALTDDKLGTIAGGAGLALPPGQSVSVISPGVVINATVTNVATWSAATSGATVGAAAVVNATGTATVTVSGVGDLGATPTPLPTPTSTPSPTATPTPSPIAFTGSNTAPMLVLAATLIGAGLLAVRTARRGET